MLAAGNTVVLKPSEQTRSPPCAWRSLPASFPRGVINIVCGRGESVGAAGGAPAGAHGVADR